MLCKDIIQIIEAECPAECALEWDNAGLLAGREEKEVKRIYVALDPSDEVIEEAVKMNADMLITHHPLIFSGIKRITDQEFVGRRVLRLIQSDISYYAAHTNYDVRRMAALSCRRLGLDSPEVLEVTHVKEDGTQEGIGSIAKVSETTLAELSRRVKEVFHLKTVRVFGEPPRLVQKVAVCPGSGKSVIPEALRKRADVLITGDIGHHEGIDSAAQGLAVIDAGHYGMEYIFEEDMKQYLEGAAPELEVKAAPIRHPFINV